MQSLARFSNSALALPNVRRSSIGFCSKMNPVFTTPWRRMVTMRGLASSKDTPLAWPVDRVRSQFVDFFRDNYAHTMVPSSPVVPHNDPTLLFANAGMNQFKALFTATIDPNSPLAKLRRAVNSQKCIRAGGKHNDLDDVGRDSYHHTFFEMLGTWSFGDYFKDEAIEWAFRLLTQAYGLDSNRLYASYFGGDEANGLPADTAARDLWLKFLPAERVIPFSAKDNFWEMGETGPCGPCTEIHYDRIGGRDASSLVNADDPDVIEIWNLVFIQFNREVDGSLRPLPAKHIDTGMGLERLTSILQEVRSNYDTDVFTDIFAAIHKAVGGEPYRGKFGEDDSDLRDMAYRVVADHLRTLSFAIADGATPSKEGRGYVLRRILRRAVRYSVQKLGAKPGYLADLVPSVVSAFGGAFPELREAEQLIQDTIREEELAFAVMLAKGEKYFRELADELTATGTNIVPGEKAFFLFDTLGFPIDLTQIMAEERGLRVDVERFNECMETQKERSRQAQRLLRLAGLASPISLGAEEISWLQKSGIPLTNDSHKYTVSSQAGTPLASKVAAIMCEDKSFLQALPVVSGATVGIVLDQTNFYAESGGQVSDNGRLLVQTPGGDVVLDVVDVQVYGGYVLHTCIVAEGTSASELRIGDVTAGSVDVDRRKKVAPNHSMTHVLSLALRNVLGNGVTQRGSLVSSDKLRFDFSSTRALSSAELTTVETNVNKIIESALPVKSSVLPLVDATRIPGVRTLEGEIYPDPVRVLSIGTTAEELLAGAQPTGDISVEFCGGTHVENTSEAEAFCVVEETAIAKGTRRITAVTGSTAQEILLRSELLRRDVSDAASRVEYLVQKPSVTAEELSSLDNVISVLKQRVAGDALSQATRSETRTTIEEVSKSLFAAKTRLANEALDHAVETSVAQVSTDNSIAVLHCVVSIDSKNVKRAVDLVHRLRPELSFILVSQDGDKVNLTASVTSTHRSEQNLDANAWVRAVVSAAGGRGGGKPEQAQGSVSLAAASLDALSKLAEEYITKCR